MTMTTTATTGDVDAFHRRIRTQLRKFTNWLVANEAKGFIGEVGWPHELAGQPPTDAAAWNALANAWYADANAANLWVTGWATGLWIGPSYNLGIYSKVGGSSINTPESQASVLEAHPTTGGYARGINLTGAENAKGYPSSQPFSNQNLGRMGWEYTYPNLASFQYLAGRGIKLVRLPFRWERIQPSLNQPLQSSELTALKNAVAQAKSSGLQVVLDVHNYGRYNMVVSGTTSGKLIGSPEVPISAFQDLWTRLSTEFKNDPDVFYGLMNEPHDFNITSGGLTGNRLWEKISQDALNAIRANGDNKLVMVPGNRWSGAQNWPETHPTAWIVDPANNFRYEAHHYWDTDNSGDYSKQVPDPNDPTKQIWVPQPYSDCLADAERKGYVADPAATEKILDNTAPAGTTGVTILGSWVASSGAGGYYGSNYLHNNNTGRGSKSVIYQPDLSATATYNVFLQWSAHSNRASNVPVDIFTSNGVQTVYVNQKTNGGAWISLGVFPLTWSNAYVKIRTDNTDGYVVADAVKWTPAP